MGTTGWRLGLVAGLVGAVAVLVLGLLTAGVGATAAPRGVPLAVAVEPGDPLAPLAERVAQQGGDAVAWRVVDPVEATRLLDAAEVYGVLALAAGPAGPALTTTTSGAVPAAGTQVAEQVLARAAAGLGAAVAERGGPAPVVTAQAVHPSSPAARTLPLSATALLWIGGLAANLVLLLLARPGAPAVGAALTGAGLVAVLGPAVVVAYSGLWGLDVEWTGGALGFLGLTAVAFALLQAGVLRLLGIGGTGVLALLYLSAPAVAGQVPELLHPAYRDGLWSWTPFRFGTEALRSLLFSGGTAPAVGAGLAVVGGIAVLGLALLAVPRRAAVPPAATAEPLPVG
jgi:hypothetical protein